MDETEDTRIESLSLREILAEIESRSDAIERLTSKTKGLMVPKAERDESQAGLERRLAQVPTQPKRKIQGTLVEEGDYGLS